jgi:valyl-tRNA synthetase
MTQSILNLAGTFNENILNNFETCQKIVSEVRNIRTQKNITFKEKLTLEAVDTNPVGNLNPIILKMANLEEIKVVKTKSVGALSFMLGTSEFAVCLGNLADIESELAKLKADLAHLEKFLLGVTRKLENKNFVANAPQAVVENERKKMADTCSKIATIKENIRSLKI